MDFKLHITELTDNDPITDVQVTEMAFYVKQALHRYLEMVNKGYIFMEEQFGQSEFDTYTIDFDPSNQAHRDYAKSRLLHNLQDMYRFSFVESDKRTFLENNMHMSDGSMLGGMNDFLAETLPPCLSYQSLAANGVMEDFFDINIIFRLLIAFFANLKMVYGSLYASSVPDLGIHTDNIFNLIGHERDFSFRELTMLSGYKTERAVRNLASPSTPINRRLSVVKHGRLTFVEHEEALRWLAVNIKK